MNNLIIDIGNTQTKIAVFSDGNLIVNKVTNTIDKQEVLQLIKAYDIKNAIISNVSAKNDYEDFLSTHLQLLSLSPTTDVPFKNNYDGSTTLGVDRIALSAAAVKLFPNTNCLVIDCGTCITYDFIDKNNTYHGGAISPGLIMRLKAMNSYTAKLPLLQFSIPDNYLGNNTQNCMLSGVYFGIIYEINGFATQYEEQYENIQIIICGGDAPFLAKHLKSNIFAAENFLLYGLNTILEHNTK